jgi:S-adenosylhomocysteine hydrolase
VDKFNVHEGSTHFDSHQSFDKLFVTLIERFATDALRSILKKKIRKLVIIDDGGYLIDFIGSNYPSDLQVCAVEQTSAGYHFLKERNHLFPVINVARSKAKLSLETPFIVKSFFKRFSVHFPDYFNSTRSILILGKGTIGSHLEQELKNKHFVYCYDPSTSLENSLKNNLLKFDLIIGASGVTSLKYEMYAHLKPGSILASISSSDREFDAHHFRGQFAKTDSPLINFTNKNITLLQAGFPLNFWGSENNIPLENIQITLALMMGAVYQSLSNNNLTHGLNHLEEDFQQSIFTNVNSLSAHKTVSKVAMG